MLVIGIYFLMVLLLAVMSVFQFGTVFAANDELKVVHNILFNNIHEFDRYSNSAFLGNQGFFGWLAIGYKEVWNFFGLANPYILKELAVVIHLSQLYFFCKIGGAHRIKFFLFIFVLINPVHIYYSFAGVRDVLIITATNLVVIHLLYGKRILPAVLFSILVAMSRIMNSIPLFVLSLTCMKNTLMRNTVLFFTFFSLLIVVLNTDYLSDFQRIFLSQIERFRSFQTSESFLNSIRLSASWLDDLLFLFSPLLIPFPESKLLVHSFTESIDSLYDVTTTIDWLNARSFKVFGWIMLHSVIWSSISCMFFRSCRKSITRKHIFIIVILWISACAMCWFDSNDARFLGLVSGLSIVCFELFSDKKIFNQLLVSFMFGLSLISVLSLIYSL